MSKIMKYELRRVVWNRFFFCFFAGLMLYGYCFLAGKVILGVANTAPFSSWGLGYYIGNMTPILCLGELFMLLLFFSKKEQAVGTITNPTPFSKSTYMAVRSFVVGLVLLFLSLLLVVMGIVFMGVLFHKYPIRDAILTFLLTAVPCMVFTLGSGMFLGRKNPLLLLVLAGVCFLGFHPLVDAYHINFYQWYPGTIPALDPEFQVPGWMIGKQAGILVTGIVFLILGWNQENINRK